MSLQPILDDQFGGGIVPIITKAPQKITYAVTANTGGVTTIAAGATVTLQYTLYGIVPGRPSLLSFAQPGVSTLWDWQTHAGIIVPDTNLVFSAPSPAMLIGSTPSEAIRVMPDAPTDPDETVATAGGYALLTQFVKYGLAPNRACLGWRASNGQSLVSAATGSRIAIETAWLENDTLKIKIRSQATTGGPFTLSGTLSFIY